MKVIQLVFSPTGGTQKVTDIITKEWGMATTKVDLTNPETDFSAVSIEKNDLVVFAVPSYAGRVPTLAMERFFQICGNGANCVLVCVYGNRAYEDTLLEMSDLAQERQFSVIAGVSAIAEHSIMHQYATGRPDQQDEQQLQSIARQIWKKVENNDDSIPKLVGNRPYKQKAVATMIPQVEETCTSCGLCARNCPAQAIPKESPNRTDEEKCISCMRCVVQCPKSARKVDETKVASLAERVREVCLVKKDCELFI